MNWLGSDLLLPLDLRQVALSAAPPVRRPPVEGPLEFLGSVEPFLAALVQTAGRGPASANERTGWCYGMPGLWDIVVVTWSDVAVGETETSK